MGIIVTRPALPLITSVVGVLLSTTAHGQSTPDTVIVDGVRFEAALADIGHHISLITAQDIERRQDRFVLDALQYSSGLQTIQSGSYGAVSSVSIRGLPSGQTRVVLDGVALNNPTSFNSGFNFGPAETGDLDRIEIFRGPQSTLFGSNAIGGVINMVSAQPGKGLHASGLFEAGSQYDIRTRLVLSHGGENKALRASFNQFHSEGISSAAEQNGNPEKDGFESLTGSIRGDIALSETLNASLWLRHQSSNSEYDGFSTITFLPADADNTAEQEDTLLRAALAYTPSSSARHQHELSISYMRTDQLSTEAGATALDAVGERLLASYQGSLDLSSRIGLIWGAEYEAQEASVRTGFGGSATGDLYSGFGLLKIAPVEGVTLYGGVRHDRATDFASNAGLSNTAFSASGVIALPLSFTLRGSFGEGFRAPSVSEYSQNPNLRPERATGYDIGLERALFSGRVEIAATYFSANIDDLIGYDPFTFLPINIEKFETRGVEVSLTAQPTKFITGALAYTYTDAKNLTTNSRANLIPDHRISADITAQLCDGWDATLNVIYNGSEEFFGTPIDAYTLVHLTSSVSINDQLALYGRVENIADKNYVDNPGYGSFPRRFHIGLKAHY